jgi:hypothetical protein
MNSEEFQQQYLGTFEQPALSELLTKFYRAYCAWVDDGAPEIRVFRRDKGLCGNVMCWADAIGKNGLCTRLLRDELRMQFKHAGMDMEYPFNPAVTPQGPYHYYHSIEQPMAICHQNPKRIAWAREHAA